VFVTNTLTAVNTVPIVSFVLSMSVTQTVLLNKGLCKYIQFQWLLKLDLDKLIFNSKRQDKSIHVSSKTNAIKFLLVFLHC
jgi:hypothetical protein